MLGLFRSLITKVRLYFMRRRQYDNLALRRYFREQHRVDVGMYSYGCFDRWRMRGPMRVGRYCSISGSARTALNNHPYEALTTHPALYERKFGVVDKDVEWNDELVIEDDVWIGHNALILAGCKHIGRGAIVGAGAVVTRNVEPYTIVAGNPARKLRDRFPPELARAIEESRWWELDLKDLRRLVHDRPSLIFSPTPAEVVEWIKAGRP